MTGLFGSRTRHTSRATRSHISSRAPTKPRRRKENEDVEEVKKPEIGELREKRATYYTASLAERRKISAARTVKSKSHRSAASTTLKTSSQSEHKHRRRKHKSSSEGIKLPQSNATESRRRTEDYVYGPRPSPELEPATGKPAEEQRERPKTEHRRSNKHSRSSHRHSLPTVLETEVTPDDSISQVAERADVARDRYDARRAHIRPSLKRSSTTSSRLPPLSEAPGEGASIAASKRPTRRDSSSLGLFMRRHSTTSIPTPPRLVECLTCGSDDVPSTQSAKLECTHRMCHECLKRVFEMSVKDPAHMPPRCCTDQHIPLKHVDKLFDTRFKMNWNRKYQEYHTKNRIYCPTLKCGEWVKPSHIHSIQGRKVAICPRCQTKVCTLCNNKMHKSSDCPEDPEIAKLVEQAKEEGWQRCYSCSALIEKREGCNHITCRCMAEFCIVCGAKWKTCDCAWFDYAHLPNPDRLNDMRVPEPIQVIYRQVFRDAPRAPPPAAGPRAQVQVRTGRGGPAPEVTYQQELDERRRQERLDADLARRLQLQSLMDPDDAPPIRHRAHVDPFGIGIGNVAGHFLNDDFVQNAANVVMNAFGDADFGRRGERSSGRRRRTRQATQNDGDAGLMPNFLGDESILG